MPNIFDEIISERQQPETIEEEPSGNIFDIISTEQGLPPPEEGPPGLQDLSGQNALKALQALFPFLSPEQRRMMGQLGARGAESIVSLPGELAEFGERFVPRETLKKGAEKIGLGKGAEILLDTFEKYAPSKALPRKQEVRQFTKDLFGDTFEPQTEAEEFVGETFGEFASLVFPFLGAVKPLRALITTIGANAAKQTGEWLGLSDKASSMMKLGTYVLGSFIQPGTAKNFYERNYKAAGEALPENATVSSTRLSASLDGLEKELRKGGVSSADTGALKQIRNIRKQMEGAQTPIDSLIAGKRKINIDRGNIYEQLKGNKSGIRTANRNMEKISKIVDDSLSEYAKQNPEWGKYYREANNAFGAFQNSQKASKFIKGSLGRWAVKHAAFGALLGHLGGIKALAVGGAAVVLPYQVSKTLSQIFNSKPLAKEFQKLYQAALQGNLKAATESVKKIDAGLTRLEE